MSVRIRRLKADYKKISSVFTKNSRIRVLKTIGNPPEKYQIEFLVRSLQKNLQTEKIHAHNSFIVEIVLTSAYPRMAPQCKMLTPVFHPNIAPHAICIGDHWAAGESLPNLIVRIAEMLSYQSYNIKSPLNGEAARWTEHNQDKLPTDKADFSSILTKGEVIGRREDGKIVASRSCANCGAKGQDKKFEICVNQHVACESCKLNCNVCGAVLCLQCKLQKCSICKKVMCHKCTYKCPSCNMVVCKKHVSVCHICKKWRCHDCIIKCSSCGKATCLDHIIKKVIDGKKQFICNQCSP